MKETIPVAASAPLVLMYPKWLPGNHSTTGAAELLAGLSITAGSEGTRVAWTRDAENMHAFHVEVPAGLHELELRFQFITPTREQQGRRMIAPDLLRVHWEKNLLYPAGHYATQILVQPSVRLPSGWEFATALDGARRAGDFVHFAAVPLDRLVDSPLYAGRNYRRFELDKDPQAPVRLHVLADRPSELEARPEQIEAHRRMVREAIALFGSRHYAHYDFLLAISDNLTDIGLAHHQSSENGVGLGYFTDWDSSAPGRDVTAHEFEHSWNGKFRRPADLWTPSFEVPMHDSLLRVYEGQTEFWGIVLAARSGLWSEEFTRDMLALYAATFDAGRAGRTWRSLQDTTNQPIIAYGTPLNYPSWQRGKDYYTEGAFLWLDVDTKLRELTRGRRSLDGIARGGWRLVYTDAPSAAVQSIEKARKQSNFSFSLGLTVDDRDGRVADVVWEGAAFDAGIAPGMTLLAVNGRAWSPAVMKEAIDAARAPAPASLELLVRDDDTFRRVKIDYHGGLRYPHLERVQGAPDWLAALLKPRTPISTDAGSQ